MRRKHLIASAHAKHDCTLPRLSAEHDAAEQLECRNDGGADRRPMANPRGITVSVACKSRRRSTDRGRSSTAFSSGAACNPCQFLLMNAADHA
jgi:hypothetical protein